MADVLNIGIFQKSCNGSRVFDKKVLFRFIMSNLIGITGLIFLGKYYVKAPLRSMVCE